MGAARAAVIIVPILLWGLAASARAAHPMLTEDPGTQGTGKFELELGIERGRDSGSTALEFGPQLSYGVLDNLDLVVRPTWLDVRGGGGGARGLGDTALDFKWRFCEQGPLAFGIRAGVDAPTGSDDKGLGRGGVSPHVVLIAGYDYAPWSFYANLDYAHDPLVGDRRDLYGASIAATFFTGGGWRFSAEVGVATNPLAGETPWFGVARAGAILTLTSWVDVDVGYQAGLNRAAPAQLILAGATLRW